MNSQEIVCGILPSKVRLGLFFVFLVLLASQTYLVLYLEQEITAEANVGSVVNGDSKSSQKKG